MGGTDGRAANNTNYGPSRPATPINDIRNLPTDLELMPTRTSKHRTTANTGLLPGATIIDTHRNSNQRAHLRTAADGNVRPHSYSREVNARETAARENRAEVISVTERTAQGTAGSENAKTSQRSTRGVESSRLPSTTSGSSDRNPTWDEEVCEMDSSRPLDEDAARPPAQEDDSMGRYSPSPSEYEIREEREEREVARLQESVRACLQGAADAAETLSEHGVFIDNPQLSDLMRRVSSLVQEQAEEISTDKEARIRKTDYERREADDRIAPAVERRFERMEVMLQKIMDSDRICTPLVTQTVHTPALTSPKAPVARQQEAKPRNETAQGPTYSPKYTPPINPLKKNNAARLIIKLRNPIPTERRITSIQVRDQINAILRPLLNPTGHSINGIDWTIKGNIIVFAGEGVTAERIAPHTAQFIRLLIGDAEWTAAADTKWWKLQLTGVLVHNEYWESDESSSLTPDEICSEFYSYNQVLANTEMAAPPRWMANPDALHEKPRGSKGSVVLAFRKQEDAQMVIDHGGRTYSTRFARLAHMSISHPYTLVRIVGSLTT